MKISALLALALATIALASPVAEPEQLEKHNASRRVLEQRARAAKHSATKACTRAARLNGADRPWIVRDASGSLEKGAYGKQYIS
ncbi:hypothetical protein V499_07341 [Pseudogymnoascus sp. VKM F-103]|nr:hypothetical protein V499_07341 [Pseudogymnoascus sp. VKM F-103]